MKKVILVYFSTKGKTEAMANYIAEGIRFSGVTAWVKNISSINDPAELNGFEGYLIGSPTFSLDIPQPARDFLSRLRTVYLANRLAGTFGPYLHDESYRHDEHAPALILAELQSINKMKPCSLGTLSLQENIIETRDGIKACQEFGRQFGAEL